MHCRPEEPRWTIPGMIWIGIGIVAVATYEGCSWTKDVVKGACGLYRERRRKRCEAKKGPYVSRNDDPLYMP